MTLESDLRAAIHKIACDFEVLLGELREAKAAPPSLHSKPSECPTCGPGCYEQGQVPPPAPPFVLGPKTMAKFALIGSNVEIIQMAARLIAEWLRRTRLSSNIWADRIERGDWSKE